MRKTKRMLTSNVGKIKAMRIYSFEITFKRESIIKNKISFNENFGAGTYYDRGEECIFLYECLNKGLKIKFVNKQIAEVKHERSSWFAGFNNDYFKKQGRVFKELSPKHYKLLIIQYAIRKYPLYRKSVKLHTALKLMLYGT